MPYKDKEAKNKYQVMWANKNRDYWIESQGGKCIKCGNKERLEVDHIDPSKKISHRVYSWSKERRDKELSKCQVLCYDCHLFKTLEQRRLRRGSLKEEYRIHAPTDGGSSPPPATRIVVGDDN